MTGERRRVKELMAEWATLRFALSETEAAEAWAESMARHEATDLAATRLPGESPCYFVSGLDGWTNCAVHGWSGPREQRSRVLVCPDSNTRSEPTETETPHDVAIKRGSEM